MPDIRQDARLFKYLEGWMLDRPRVMTIRRYGDEELEIDGRKVAKPAIVFLFFLVRRSPASWRSSSGRIRTAGPVSG